MGIVFFSFHFFVCNILHYFLFKTKLDGPLPMSSTCPSLSPRPLDFQHWTCVEVSDKLCIPQCLRPPSHYGYLVHRSKVGSIVAGCIGATLPGERYSLLNMRMYGCLNYNPTTFILLDQVRRRQKYYTPRVRSDLDLSTWPPNHHSTFHVTEMPALTFITWP